MRNKRLGNYVRGYNYVDSLVRLLHSDWPGCPVSGFDRALVPHVSIHLSCGDVILHVSSELGVLPVTELQNVEW